MDVNYINDGNQDKIRFEDGNGNQMTDQSVKKAEKVIGIYLTTFRTIPTSSINVVIKNIEVGT